MSEAFRRGETFAPRVFGPFTAASIAAYAAASADANPLHTDAALAAKAGLARPPIHGMLIMGCFETYLAHCRPSALIRKLSAKFIRPVLVDEGIEISAKVVQATPAMPAVLRLTVKRHAVANAETDLVCLGEAYVDP